MRIPREAGQSGVRSSSIKMSPFSSEPPPLLVLESLDTSTNSNFVLLVSARITTRVWGVFSVTASSYTFAMMLKLFCRRDLVQLFWPLIRKKGWVTK